MVLLTFLRHLHSLNSQNQLFVIVSSIRPARQEEAPAKVCVFFLLQGLIPFLRMGLVMNAETNTTRFSTVFTTLLVKAGFVCVVLVRVICYITWNCSRLAGLRGNSKSKTLALYAITLHVVQFLDFFFS